jgi:hypothetical protein
LVAELVEGASRRLRRYPAGLEQGAVALRIGRAAELLGVVLRSVFPSTPVVSPAGRVPPAACCNAPEFLAPFMDGRDDQPHGNAEADQGYFRQQQACFDGFGTASVTPI